MQSILARNQYPGTSTALQGLTGGWITALKPCYAPSIPDPVWAGISNDWCITVFIIVSQKMYMDNVIASNHLSVYYYIFSYVNEGISTKFAVCFPHVLGSYNTTSFFLSLGPNEGVKIKGKSWQRLCPLLQPNPSSCVKVMKHHNDFCLPSFGAWAGQSKATKEWWFEMACQWLMWPPVMIFFSFCSIIKDIRLKTHKKNINILIFITALDKAFCCIIFDLFLHEIIWQVLEKSWYDLAIFLISQQKHMLWVLIRSTSLRCF